MPKATFFPIGNADTCLLELADGRRALFDFAAKGTGKADDKRIDLPEALRKDLTGARRTSYRLVAFTHLDDDHVCGAGAFFHFDHDPNCQGDGRVVIEELWVPAAALLDEKCEGDAALVQAEAWHRLKKGAGVRVFSRPKRLEAQLKQHGLSLESRGHLITDAGRVVPGFTLAADGVEFFAHAPFASRTNDGTLFDRNDDGLAVQATFRVGSRDTRVLLLADLGYEVLEAMVATTLHYGNEDRLRWDLLNVAHHSSYKSLAPEPGTTMTTPTPVLKRLHEEFGNRGAVLVSTSWTEAQQEHQPPHAPTIAYYKSVASKLGGRYLITMDHPSKLAPKPLVVKIDAFGVTVENTAPGGYGGITGGIAPRVG